MIDSPPARAWVSVRIPAHEWLMTHATYICSLVLQKDGLDTKMQGEEQQKEATLCYSVTDS